MFNGSGTEIKYKIRTGSGKKIIMDPQHWKKTCTAVVSNSPIVFTIMLSGPQKEIHRSRESSDSKSESDD
jgi:hypothetical protein